MDPRIVGPAPVPSSCEKEGVSPIDQALNFPPLAFVPTKILILPQGFKDVIAPN
jgi:hypothetical protein